MERRAFVKSGAIALVTMGLSPSFLRRTAFGMELTKAPNGNIRPTAVTKLTPRPAQ